MLDCSFNINTHQYRVWCSQGGKSWMEIIKDRNRKTKLVWICIWTDGKCHVIILYTLFGIWTIWYRYILSNMQPLLQPLCNYVCWLDLHDRSRVFDHNNWRGGEESVNSKAPPFLLTFALGCFVGVEAESMGLLYGVWWHYWCDPSPPPPHTYAHLLQLPSNN